MGNRRKRERDKVEAAIRIRTVAEPRQAGEPVKARIERAAVRLRWPYSRVENIWRREAQRIESWEMDELRNYIPRDD